MINTVPLKKNYEFLRVYKKGKFYVGKYLTAYMLPNNLNINRLGITVSKKVGKSVKRNRIRRLFRENYRLFEDFIYKGYDIVFVSRSSDKIPDFIEIKKEMKFLLKRLNIFDQEKWDCLKSC
jgi:ribonuclease P protein component